MIEKNIIEDLNKLVQVSSGSINKLNKLEEYLIGQYVYETFLDEKENTIKINLGFGDLLLKYEEGSIKTKFILSKELNNDIESIFKGKEPELNTAITNSLKTKLIEFGKELI